MADSRIPADVNDAVHDLVKAFGAENLAAKTGTPAGTIYNKANPNESSHHKPTLSDVLIWTQISGDYRIVYALCRVLGGTFVPLHVQSQASDLELMNIIMKREVEQGQFADVLNESMGDGKVSADDFKKLHREGWDVITAWLELLARLEGMVRD